MTSENAPQFAKTILLLLRCFGGHYIWTHTWNPQVSDGDTTLKRVSDVCINALPVDGFPFVFSGSAKSSQAAQVESRNWFAFSGSPANNAFLRASIVGEAKIQYNPGYL